MVKQMKTAAFTLIELLIVGILASIGVPKYFRAVERSKVVEGTRIVRVIGDAIQRYCMRQSAVPLIADLDVDIPALQYFGVPAIGGGSCTTWSVTVTRNANGCPPPAFVPGYSCPNGTIVVSAANDSPTYTNIPVSVQP